MSEASGSRRWRDQRWIIDDHVRALGIEFDQNRLRYSLGPVRDETSAADIGILRSSIRKLGDLSPLSMAHARRHEALAARMEDRGHATTAGVHWFAAAQLWLLAAYPIWETTDELVDLHRRKTAAFNRWAAVAAHRVEQVDVPFGDGALPGWLHLPADARDGTPLPVLVASDGMDGGRESLVNRVGDEYLQNGFAVLAIDGPGQSEAAVRGIFTSPENWAAAGDAIVRWIDTRADLDGNRVVTTGISFGSYFMSLLSAVTPRIRGCAVVLQCFEPGAHAIFERAAPGYKSRHMWMAGLEHDEDAFDELVARYDLREQITGMSCPWYVLGGEADELCDKRWVYAMTRLCPTPASSLLYEGATHAIDDSPASALGPFFRTEIADWLADRVTDDAPDATNTHRLVTRGGEIVPASVPD
ncbi:MAG TPA: alpha/beta hydrolase [Pseudonocardia sp.]